MLKKEITYVDFDDNERTETFYFNLTRAEVMELELGTFGGLEAAVNKMVSERNGALIMSTFKNIIRKAYGEKSLDGKYLMKSDEISDKFEATNAYDVLFMEVCTDAEKAAAFMNAIVPKTEEQKSSIPAPALVK